MTKHEKEIIIGCLDNIRQSDDKIEALEDLFSVCKQLVGYK